MYLHVRTCSVAEVFDTSEWHKFEVQACSPFVDFKHQDWESIFYWIRYLSHGTTYCQLENVIIYVCMYIKRYNNMTLYGYACSNTIWFGFHMFSPHLKPSKTGHAACRVSSFGVPSLWRFHQNAAPPCQPVRCLSVVHWLVIYYLL